ncbi:transcriptional regulator [Schaalia sp. 19OD2882]|uniref:Rv2175c family DNA-binding protein n=1 Tax=Schaalia sp. 19OD2882 TaxID=2794089 RepID=UPI001C1EAD38|nr:Rv2175c family DNA-binding protein [Schaalia sp. 19OD2882]QWW18873.1 transcriptional regulator [Schaalia sp. 19OD2882]
MSDAPELLSFDEAARLLGIEARRIKQLVRDHILFSVKDEGGKPAIPAEIIVRGANGWEPLFNLPGTLTLLDDNGFSAEEAVAWLYTEQEELGQTPMQALLEGRHHRVNSIAGALGF